jgi:hypothetical protein
MFMGFPEQDSLLRGTDPDSDPSIIIKNSKKTLIPSVL